MVYNIATQGCTVYLDRTCVIGAGGKPLTARNSRQHPSLARPMDTIANAQEEAMQQYSEARRFNIKWRLWHMQNANRSLHKNPADILQSSPKLWETKMEFIANSPPQPQNTATAPEEPSIYFRHVAPEPAPQSAQKSELRKVLGTSDPVRIPRHTSVNPSSSLSQKSNGGTGGAMGKSAEEKRLREAFTRVHNQRALNNRVAFLGDESSMRKFRNMERLEGKLGLHRRRQGRIELEQKAEIYFEQPNAHQESQEPLLFTMPTDPCIYSTNPVSAWFLPFAISCTPNETARAFIQDPRTCSFAGHVRMRKAGTKAWHRRWICLRYDFLFEYVDKTDAKPVGVLHLEDATCNVQAETETETEAETIELSLFESRITAARTETSHATSAPKKAMAAKMHGSHASYLNRLSLGSVSPKTVLELQPEDGRSSDLHNVISAAKRLNLDGMYSVNKTRIGQGRFAHVLTAKRKSDGKKCAVKVIRKHEFWALVEGGKERTDTVSREIATQLYLTSSEDFCTGIVKLWDVFETRDFVVLELDLMQKTDLFQLLKAHKVLQETQARKIIRHLVKTIGMLQEKKIAHRDIKLSNIVFPDGDGEVIPKIVDFGMAAFVGKDGFVTGRCGTPGYVAPEILDARPNTGYQNRVDLFSLGVVAYTLLCGYEPFYGTGEKELIASNRRCKVSYNRKGWENISGEAKDFVQGLLMRDPSERLTVEKALSHPWMRHAPRRGPQASTGEPGDDSGGCTIS